MLEQHRGKNQFELQILGILQQGRRRGGLRICIMQWYTCYLKKKTRRIERDTIRGRVRDIDYLNRTQALSTGGFEIDAPIRQYTNVCNPDAERERERERAPIHHTNSRLETFSARQAETNPQQNPENSHLADVWPLISAQICSI